MLLITSMACCCLWISCGKDKPESPKVYPKVNIDAALRLGLNDVSIAASYENAGAEPVIKKGFCWSTAQNPGINDHKIEIAPSALFSDTIYDVGQNATIYFRAYVQTADSIYYSENVTIITGGVDNSLLNTLNDGSRRHIRQVIETTDNHFLQLIIVVGAGISWTQVVKLDKAGNVLWKKDYYAGTNKHPDEIMEVADGYLFVATGFVNPVKSLSITKIDFDGVKAWEKTFAQKTNQELIRTKVLPGNQVMLTMISYDAFLSIGRSNCSIDEFVIDLAGNGVSEKTLLADSQITRQGDTWLGLNTPDGGFSMTSHYTDPASSIFDQLAIQKFNAANQLEWEKLYSKARVYGPASSSLTPAGAYDMLAVFEQSGKLNSWVMEIDKSNGNKNWEFIYDTNKYGLPVSTVGNKLYLDASGNVYVFGTVTDPSDTGANLFVLKLTSNGKQLWNYVFKIPKGESAGPEAILKQGNEIYLFGAIFDSQVVGSNSLFMTKIIDN